MNTAMALSGAGLALPFACACALVLAGCSSESEPGSTESGSSDLQVRDMRLIRFQDHRGDAGAAECEHDGGQPSAFTSCAAPDECVAVPLGGCCNNGWKTAVNREEVDAYKEATACDEARPICPMYIVHDTRVAVCDLAQHQCEMVQPSL